MKPASGGFFYLIFNMNYKTIQHSFLADTITPVSAYLKLKEHYTPCLLLESSDYHTKENSFSFICCEALEEFTKTETDREIPRQLSDFIRSIVCTTNDKIALRFNSIFGFSTYEAVQSFEKIDFNKQKDGVDIPNILYHFFRFIIVFNHFNETIHLIENIPSENKSEIEVLKNRLFEPKKLSQQSFRKLAERTSNISDTTFKKFVTRGKHHCQIGDVFQIVLSRRFSQQFEGDTFLLYRALRSINPSPFSFYFDYGDFQILGASPEAQILVRNNLAEIHPIAGTFKRTGNDDDDSKQAKELFNDPKENAEHVMLVDLARNDLSKNTKDVKVATYKDIQFYSHVIHLVSKVTGILDKNSDSRQLYADTFPAGTLSGAPKYRAMEIIDETETTKRGIYGGAIGAFGLNGDVNHAIAIRTFLAKNNTLYYQAGAGIVIDSKEESENQEVYNKLRALEIAMEKAEQISNQ